MPCPNCNSASVECIQEIYEPMKHHEEYICNVCGCQFAWDSTQTILEDPEEKQESNTKCLRCGIKLDQTNRDHFDWWPYCGRFCHDTHVEEKSGEDEEEEEEN